jgi:hypothetical protein
VNDPEDDVQPEEPQSLAEQLQRLREDVDLLLLTRTDTTPRPGTPDTSWQAMSPARAGDAWTALIEWVDDLVDRYALDENIPICWYAHGAMVEELHALHIAWLGAYAGRPSQPSERALWHELLSRTLIRIREWNRHGCAAGTHRRDEPVTATDSQRTSRAAHVHADIQARARRDGARPLEVS